MANDGKIYMLNALWFKPNGGAAQYQEYLKATGPQVAKYGGRRMHLFHRNESLIGKFDAALLFLVEWPNQKAFDDFRVDPEFKKVSPLREAAIKDSLLIRCSNVWLTPTATIVREINTALYATQTR